MLLQLAACSCASVDLFVFGICLSVVSYCSSGAGERQACLEDFVKSPSKCEGGLREGIE